MVLPRLVTALVGAPVFLWSLYVGSPAFSLFVLGLVAAGLWEFDRMADTGGYATQGLWGISWGIAPAALLVFPGVRAAEGIAGQWPLAALAALGPAALAREMFRRDKSLSALRASMTLAGSLFIAWPWGVLILLRDLRGPGDPSLYHAGRSLVVFLTALIWAQDIAAWSVGSVLGRRRLAPSISPQKSWEGAVAGLAAAVGAGMFVREILLPGLFSRTETAVLAAGLGILAQLSDLGESLLKRCFGVKDSSALLPGHGGVLDRFDSFLFSAPALYYYVIFMGKAL
jgi:phosphatidate cytidylyltransferase